MAEIEDRLVDLARTVGAEAQRPGFELVAGRARRRRRTRALSGAALMVGAVVVTVAVLAPRHDPGATAPTPPAVSTEPSASAGQLSIATPADRGTVTRVEVLPGGMVFALYDRCPPATRSCAARAYTSRDNGSTWDAAPLPEAREGETLWVRTTTAGDVVLTQGQRTLYFADGTGAWRTPQAGGRPLHELDPAHAALINGTGGAQTRNQFGDGVLDTTTGQVTPRSLPDKDFPLRAAPSTTRPGLLIGSEASNQRNYLSFDFGSTWTALPAEFPGASFESGPQWQNSTTLVNLVAGDHGSGRGFAYVLRAVRTSTDRGRTWRDTTVASDPVVDSHLVTPLPDGGFLGANLRGRLLQAGPDAVFKPVAVPPGEVTATGANSDTTWVVTDQTRLWLRTDPAPAWRELPLPE